MPRWWAFPSVHFHAPLQSRSKHFIRSTSTVSSTPSIQATTFTNGTPSTTTAPSRAVLKTISRMSREKAPWRYIAQETGLSVEECQRLFYTKIDWRVPYYWTIDGHPSRPDKEQIARLIYLVEHEGRTFDEIADRRLLSKRIDRKRYLRYYHPLVLEQKYAEIVRQRRRLRRQRLLDLGHAPEDLLLLRSVELFGQDWERIAQHTNAEMARVYKDERTKSVSASEHSRTLPSSTTDEPHRDSQFGQLEAADLHGEMATQQLYEPLTAETARALYHKVRRRHGQIWSEEDDALLVFMVLETMGQHHWLTPAQVPSSLSSLNHEKIVAARDFWVQVASALGNHSPLQCLQRWQSMFALDDALKQPPTDQWHRFEDYQLWMAWKFFASQPQIMQKLQAEFCDAIASVETRVPATTTTTSKAKAEARDAEENLQTTGREHGLPVKELMRVLSLSHHVVAFQRYRGVDQCQRQFERAIRRLFRWSEKDAKKAPRKSLSFDPETVVNQAIQEQKVYPLIHFIRASVADPMLARALQQVAALTGKDAITTSEENSRRLATVPKEQRLRSLWNPTLHKRLLWLVTEAKKGVKIADEDVDWDEISKKLTKEAMDDKLRGAPNITTQQCLSTWRFVQAQPGLLEAEEAAKTGQQSNDSEECDRQQVQSSRQQPWLEHEMVSLELGVRHFGTIWADIRAQYLPRRSVSEIHQKWFEISSSATEDPVLAKNRAQEEDYQALMHALKISAGPTPEPPLPSPSTFVRHQSNPGDEDEEVRK
ncbi:hypothetical protein BGZ73_001644 [Actinomortierella ambigua]|nr:hypothetical protein BGZ73_001644 [Actinomortierella ambigua]